MHSTASPNLPTPAPSVGFETATWPPSSAGSSTTALIRHDEEIADVLQLILENQARLVTLTGTGDCGKDALSTAGWRRGRRAFRLRLIQRASLDDPFLVPQVLASIVNVCERAGVPLLDTLLASLEPRHLLLAQGHRGRNRRSCGHGADGFSVGFVVNHILR